MEDVPESTSDSLDTIAKSKKPGIIYLSTLPPFMNVTKVKEIFGSYGKVGRVFLQPLEPRKDETRMKKKKKPAKHFTEGWIEFERKRVAKEVAANLNNTLIGGKKKSKFYDHTWNIKYLPRFKWVHLSERLAYERAVHKHKLRTEIAQVKREANFYKNNLEHSKKLMKKQMKMETSANNIKEEIIRTVKREENPKNIEDRTDFLKSLFNS